MSSKKMIFRFFLTYLGILIPCVLFSLVAVNTAIRDMKDSELRTIKNHLFQVKLDMDTMVNKYETLGYDLSLRSALQQENMITGNDVLDGCTTLKYATQFDDLISAAFVYYGNDSDIIYASSGHSVSDYYFSGVNFCTDESTQRALELLTSPTSGAMYLETKTPTSGFLYLHYYRPIHTIDSAQNGISLNFLIPVEKLSQFLNQVVSASSHTYINLTFASGDSIHFYTESEIIDLNVISEPAYLTEKEENRYISLTREVDSINATVQVLYRSDLLYQDFNQIQHIILFVLIFGTFISGIMCYLLAQKRWNSLHQLELMIPKTPMHATEPTSADEYNYLRSALETLVSESSSNEQDLHNYRTILKQQASMLLFNGLLKERKAAELLLNECGITLNEEYFFIGGILMDGNKSILSTFEFALSGDLYSEISIGGHTAIIFFAELPNIDRAKKIRLETAHRLSMLLQELGSKNAKIALSQVYQQISMANYAYMEVTGILEQMLQNGYDQNVECWENIIKSDEQVLQLSQTDLQKYADAINSFDEATATSSFTRMNQYILQNTASPENKRYLRYCILHPLIIAAKNSDKHNAYEEALRIDPSAEASFENAVCKVLHLYCADLAATSDEFSRILKYVEENYAQSDLSYEAVATYAGFTKTYLSRLFRAKTGMSYIEYLTQIRMEKANSLLRTTNLPIKEITQMVGYLDESSFRRKFKAFYGINVSSVRDSTKNTPSE